MKINRETLKETGNRISACLLFPFLYMKERITESSTLEEYIKAWVESMFVILSYFCITSTLGLFIWACIVHTKLVLYILGILLGIVLIFLGIPCLLWALMKKKN